MNNVLLRVTLHLCSPQTRLNIHGPRQMVQRPYRACGKPITSVGVNASISRHDLDDAFDVGERKGRKREDITRSPRGASVPGASRRCISCEATEKSLPETSEPFLGVRARYPIVFGIVSVKAPVPARSLVIACRFPIASRIVFVKALFRNIGRGTRS